MPKSGKAVVLITVFLMLIFGGCYTKLKHPRPALYADGSGVSKSDIAWDFSYGWHGPYLEMYPEAYSYYYLQWWDIIFNGGMTVAGAIMIITLSRTAMMNL